MFSLHSGGFRLKNFCFDSSIFRVESVPWYLALYLPFAVRGGPVGAGVAQQIGTARAVAARFEVAANYVEGKQVSNCLAI